MYNVIQVVFTETIEHIDGGAIIVQVQALGSSPTLSRIKKIKRGKRKIHGITFQHYRRKFKKIREKWLSDFFFFFLK